MAEKRGEENEDDRGKDAYGKSREDSARGIDRYGYRPGVVASEEREDTGRKGPDGIARGMTHFEQSRCDEIFRAVPIGGVRFESNEI